MIIYIVITTIFLLFIYFISYWFVTISELTEYFVNKNTNKYKFIKSVVNIRPKKCTKIECNIIFVNDRLKDAFTWLPYLERNIEIIEKNLPNQMNVENFQSGDDCKISQPRILSQFAKIEPIYMEIYDKQEKMKNMLKRFDKTITFSKKMVDKDCFQITNPDECRSEALKTQISNIYHKLDEVEYRTDRMFKKIEKHYKRLIEYEKKRDIAIGEVSNKANEVMKNLLGIPVDLKMGDYLKAGISNDMKNNLKAAMKGDMSQLKNMVNSPEIQNMAKMINPTNLFGKLSGGKPSDSSQFSDKGKNILGGALGNQDDGDAVKAKSKMGSSMKKIKLPKMFSSNIF